MKIKKYVWLVVIALLTFTGCGTGKLSVDERNALEKKVDQRVFTADFDYCTPFRMPARQLSSEYFVRLTPDTLYSALPYFGQVRHVPYGGGTGLNFETRVKKFSDNTQKGDWRTFTVEVSHEGDDLAYVFHIYDNGKVTLDVTSRERDYISFQGQIR